MDKKDLKIIRELEKDPKLTTSALAKKVRLSQQVVDYRIKKLQENGTIVQFGTIIDLYRLGLQQYRVFLRFDGIEHKKKKEIFGYLKKHPRVYWAARIGGSYDLLIVVEIKDFPAFESFLDRLYHAFPHSFRDYHANYVLLHEFYLHKHIVGGSHGLLKYGTGVDEQKLDELDHNILEIIKSNCRQSSLSIGQKLGVSYKTIQSRIKRMESEKIIVGQRLFMSDDTQRYILLCSYHHFSSNEEKKMFNYLREHNLVSQKLKLFGQWKLFLHLRAKNLEQVQDFLIELREKYHIIENHEIIPVFEDILINLYPLKKLS